MSAHKLACKECLLLTPTHYHTHSLTVCPLTHSQLVKHSQASHLINLDIFEEVSSPKKRTQIFEELVLVNPFSKEDIATGVVEALLDALTTFS